jgi:hypothetical protein
MKDCCKAPTGVYIKDYIYGHYMETIDKFVDDDDYPNNPKTNGCLYYRRKWYKFLIKEKNK